jgi:hypothetical protein
MLPLNGRVSFVILCDRRRNNIKHLLGDFIVFIPLPIYPHQSSGYNMYNFRDIYYAYAVTVVTCVALFYRILLLMILPLDNIMESKRKCKSDNAAMESCKVMLNTFTKFSLNLTCSSVFSDDLNKCR